MTAISHSTPCPPTPGATDAWAAPEAMDRADLARWIGAYERAWRTAGTGTLDELFTTDAVYCNAPFAEPVVGLAAIAAFWEVERDGPDEPFTMRWEPVAVEGWHASRLPTARPSRRSIATCGSSPWTPTAAAARSRSGRSSRDSRSARATPAEHACTGAPGCYERVAPALARYYDGTSERTVLAAAKSQQIPRYRNTEIISVDANPHRTGASVQIGFRLRRLAV